MNCTRVAHKIYRGSQPENENDWQYLKEDIGILYVLDLETKWEEMCATPPTALDQYSLRLGTILPPRKEDLLIAARFIQDHATDGVFVHCREGVDRTGMAIICWRMVYNYWPRDRAIIEAKALGMHWWYFYWLWTVPNFW